LGNSRLVETATLAAFDAYYEEAASRYHLPNPHDYENNPSWPDFVQVAVLCVSRGWDTSDYIRKAMGGMGGRVRSLLPSDLHKQGMARSYETYLQKDTRTGSKARDEYKRCVELLIQREMDGGDEKPLLLSPNTAFPAWFRVCYPEAIDMDIVNVWGETAKRELSASTDLIKFLRELDPDKWERVRRVLFFYQDPEGGVQ
jgi:hypothetical protein